MKLVFGLIIFAILGFAGTARPEDPAQFPTDPFSIGFGSYTPSDCSYLYSPIFPTANCLTSSGYNFLDPKNSLLSNPYGTFAPVPADKKAVVKPNHDVKPAVSNASQEIAPVQFTEREQTGAVSLPASPPAQAPPRRTSDGPSIQLVNPQQSASGSSTLSRAFSGGSTSDSGGSNVQQAPPPTSALRSAFGGSTAPAASGGSITSDSGGARSNAPQSELRRAFGGAAPSQGQTAQPAAPSSNGETSALRRAFSGASAPVSSGGGASVDSPAGPQSELRKAFSRPVPAPVQSGEAASSKAGTSELRRAFSGKQPAGNGIIFKNTDLLGKPLGPVPAPIQQPSSQVQQQDQAPAPPAPEVEVVGKENKYGVTTYPVTSGSVETRDLDLGETKPQTPILPTVQNNQMLESVCPDCLNAAYIRKFNSFKDVVDHTPGVDRALKIASHNMMKIVHMSCDADQTFVPTNYVTDLKYCSGKDCNRVGLATKIYADKQIEHFRDDQTYGDVYRKPLSPEVASQKISSDGRTCKDVHDRPFVFDVGGHPAYGKTSMDPFNYNAQKTLTGGEVNLFDCSSTINAIFAQAGLKFSTKDTDLSGAYNKSTAALVSLASSGTRGDKSSCISIPQFHGEESIHSGDVFVIHRNVPGGGPEQDYGHAMMFDEVKEDPFNISGITRVEQCDTDVDPTKFRFTIIQSSGTAIDRQVFERFKGIDLAVEHYWDKFNAVNANGKPCSNDNDPSTCDFRARFEDWGAHLIEMGKKACRAKFSSKSISASTPLPSRLPALNTRKELVPVTVSGVLVRHKGASDGCAFPKAPDVVGSQCVAGCLEK